MIQSTCPRCKMQCVKDGHDAGTQEWCAECRRSLALRPAPEPVPNDELERLRGLLTEAENRLSVFLDRFGVARMEPADASHASTELKSALRVSRVRAEELVQANELLLSELREASRKAAAAHLRVDELSQELERERWAREDAEARARELSLELRDIRRTMNADAAAPELEEKPLIVALPPELLDTPPGVDPMVRTLLRFIEPE